MIYAFVQNNPDIEILKRQRETILSYATENALSVDKWLDTDSFDPEKFEEKDVLLLEKTFRLGRDIYSITTTLKNLLNKDLIIISCEDKLKFGGDYVSSTVMAYALGIVSEISNEVRSRLTKEALDLRKQDGQKLGRPCGRKNFNHKLDSKRKQIRQLLRNNKTEAEICRLLNIPRSSLFVYIKDHPELKPKIYIVRKGRPRSRKAEETAEKKKSETHRRF